MPSMMMKIIISSVRAWEGLDYRDLGISRTRNYVGHLS